ncbi:NADP-dependent oxidoreductase [Apilactobacillus xinyiensis]|uniref:NADP-dependent oxidoreductase n=1 Tax=Apilactobacillus xinyiensis TaxID=2841032 RepID=UPI001C7D6165|nr:NADP-dependent oxidoreductase [Apilactobacillus xinyiensis]
MKVAQLDKYNKNFKLKIRQVPIPKIKNEEVLVKVKAAAVNPLDNLIGTGSVKLIQNYSMPLNMGNELSGIVEMVGNKVSKFKNGDFVYTRLPLNRIGAFAEYVAVPSSALAKLPKNLDFKSGAASALTGLTAYQGLKDILKVKTGKTIFINGGSGSFGQLAVPVANSMGLKVIVSGNPKLRENIMKLGADEYISYKDQNYWEILQNIDYVIDTIGKKEFEKELSIIKSGGKLLSLKSGPNKSFAINNNMGVIKTQLFKLAGLKLDKQAKEKNVEYHFIFVKSSGSQLEQITKIIEKNNIQPEICSTEMNIDDINEALKKVKTGNHRGKVVITF